MNGKMPCHPPLRVQVLTLKTPVPQVSSTWARGPETHLLPNGAADPCPEPVADVPVLSDTRGSWAGRWAQGVE